MSKLRKLQAGEAPEAWWAALERQAGALSPFFDLGAWLRGPLQRSMRQSRRLTRE